MRGYGLHLALVILTAGCAASATLNDDYSNKMHAQVESCYYGLSDLITQQATKGNKMTCNATKYMALKIAADKATDAWLANDSAATLAAMKAATVELNAARAAGWNVVHIAPAILDGMMNRSVFGDADRSRAAVKEAAAK